MEASQTLEEEVSEFTNVRWRIPRDAMKAILAHKKILNVLWRRPPEDFVTNEEAAIDMLRTKKLPKIIITHE